MASEENSASLTLMPTEILDEILDLLHPIDQYSAKQTYRRLLATKRTLRELKDGMSDNAWCKYIKQSWSEDPSADNLLCVVCREKHPRVVFEYPGAGTSAMDRWCKCKDSGIELGQSRLQFETIEESLKRPLDDTSTPNCPSDRFLERLENRFFLSWLVVSNGLCSPLLSPFGCLYEDDSYEIDDKSGYRFLQRLFLKGNNVILRSNLGLLEVPLYAPNVLMGYSKGLDYVESEIKWTFEENCGSWVGPVYRRLFASMRTSCTEFETLTRLKKHLLKLPVDGEIWLCPHYPVGTFEFSHRLLEVFCELRGCKGKEPNYMAFSRFECEWCNARFSIQPDVSKAYYQEDGTFYMDFEIGFRKDLGPRNQNQLTQNPHKHFSRRFRNILSGPIVHLQRCNSNCGACVICRFPNLE